VKNKPVTAIFSYGGRLSGQEESPISGIQFAEIGKDAAWLLYPARWFPVSGYTSDRYTMDLTVQVPAGYRVAVQWNRLEPGQRVQLQNDQAELPGQPGGGAGDGGQSEFAGSDERGVVPRGRSSRTRRRGATSGQGDGLLTSLFGVPPQPT